MGRINVLDKHTAELIAAGEVVERPASVIKELVENSIDAGSTMLTVEIKDGGTTLMRITDNGCGIDRDDVRRAFLRHATSKIAQANDLDSIATLGFRGEALASIAAVSRVELLTATNGASIGCRYCIDGGEEILFEEAGCPKGTSIFVRELFYNVPARMKFLKKNVTEGNAISAVMDRIALSHPEISVRLIRDGKETLRTPGDKSLKSAIFAVYGKDFTKSLIETEYSLGGVSISGYISKPSASRPNRNMQIFFINGRYVKTLTGMTALEQAYKGSIMVGKFPSCVLNIKLPPEMVDVNVHPAKTEVRFTNDKAVFDAVYHGVKSAILKGDSPIEWMLPGSNVKLSSDEKVGFFNDTVEPAMIYKNYSTVPADPVKAPSISDKPVSFIPHSRHIAPVSIDIDVEDEPSVYMVNEPSIPSIADEPPIVNPDVSHDEYSEEAVTEVKSAEIEENTEEICQTKPYVRYVGEAFATYAMFESGERLILIDKHAAHERMIYEKLKRNDGETHAQLLLSPISFTPSKEELSVLTENRALLSQVGFEIEEFGLGTILIRAVPSILDREDASSQLLEIAQRLMLGMDIGTERMDWIYHNIACRAAIKAGAKTSVQELTVLAESILEDPDLRYCPHGRPTSVILTRRELEKQFGRIQ